MFWRDDECVERVCFECLVACGDCCVIGDYEVDLFYVCVCGVFVDFFWCELCFGEFEMVVVECLC